MHSNLAPFIAHQRVADLHEQAARYRTEHPALPEQPAEQPKVRRSVSLVQLVSHTVHLRRMA